MSPLHSWHSVDSSLLLHWRSFLELVLSLSLRTIFGGHCPVGRHFCGCSIRLGHAILALPTAAGRSASTQQDIATRSVSGIGCFLMTRSLCYLAFPELICFSLVPSRCTWAGSKPFMVICCSRLVPIGCEHVVVLLLTYFERSIFPHKSVLHSLCCALCACFCAVGFDDLAFFSNH